MSLEQEHPIIHAAGEMCQAAVMKCGEFLDNLFGMVRGAGKSAVFNIGGSGDLGAFKPLSGNTPTVSPTPTHAHANSPKISGPEMSPQIQKSVASVNMDWGLTNKVHIDVPSVNSGLLPSPWTPAPAAPAIAQGQGR